MPASRSDEERRTGGVNTTSFLGARLSGTAPDSEETLDSPGQEEVKFCQGQILLAPLRTLFPLFVFVLNLSLLVSEPHPPPNSLLYFLAFFFS